MRKVLKLDASASNGVDDAEIQTKCPVPKEVRVPSQKSVGA